MIFILLAIIIVGMIYEYQFEANYILHPGMIALAMYFISIVISSSNYYRWGDIGYTTFIVILLFLASFELGCYMADRSTAKTNIYLKYFSSNIAYDYDIGFFKTIIILVFFLITTLIDISYVKTIAGYNISGFFKMISVARSKIYAGKTITYSKLFLQCLYMCRALAYIYVFSIIYHVIYRKKLNYTEMLIVLFYGIQTLLTTGRTELIYYIYGELVISYLVWMSKRKWKKRNDFKFAKQILISAIILLVLFITISNIRSGYSNNMFDIISEYTGESIQALNQYIVHNGIFQVSKFWGEETQNLFYSILKVFGKSNIKMEINLPPVYLGNGTNITNVYTAIRRYLHDYGIYGTMIISCIMGYIYSYQFKKTRINVFSGLRIIIYAFISYPLIELAIEEVFLSNLFTARTVYCLFYLCAFYILLFRRNKQIVQG